ALMGSKTHTNFPDARTRLHRQFGIPDTKQEAAPQLSDTEKEDQHDETAEELEEVNLEEESAAYSIKKLAGKLAQDVINDEDPLEDDVGDDPIIRPQLHPKHMCLFFGTQYSILNIFRNVWFSNLQKELEAYD
ncbi:hypothetical protein FRC11_001713, partial [Ceratobasidium sp. 423]